MDINKDFEDSILDYLDDNKQSNGIIVSNRFPIYKNDCNKLVSKMGNKSLIITESILRDFTIIGNYVWDCLKGNKKYLYYATIGYIAQNIKYNSNIIRLSPDRLRGYLGIEIANRDYYTMISFFKSFSIIADCEIKQCFTINPIAIYKGDIYKFVELCEANGLQESVVNNKDKLLIDKAVIIKDKLINNIEVLYNNKYYKNIMPIKKEKSLKGTVDFSIK